MKYRAKLKIKKKYNVCGIYYNLTVKFYKLPNLWTRYNYNIDNESNLLSSFNNYTTDNEKFIDEINQLFNNKEDLHKMIKCELIRILYKISSKCEYENKINDVKKIQKIIKEINKNLIIEI